MGKGALLKGANSKHCFLVLKSHSAGLPSVNELCTTRPQDTFLGPRTCRLSPVHPANWFTFHSGG